jgi:uncharacterized protein involved in response to NO
MALQPREPTPPQGGLRPLQPTPDASIARPKPIKAVKPAAPTDLRWRLVWLLAAPHRMGFFGGALMLAVSALWWCLHLFAQSSQVPLPWSVSPGVAHALTMTLGFMPLFFVGFLFTAGPKWLGMPELATRTLLPQVLGYLCGWLMALVGFHASTWLAAAGLLMVAVAWSSLTWKFADLWHRSRSTDKTHATVVVIACVLGAMALGVIVVGLALQLDTLVRTAIYAALWMFIATVFAAVSHRMIPFFGASALPVLDAWRPLWLLWSMVAILWLEGVFAVLDLWLWPFPEVGRWLQVAVEAPAAVLMLWLAIRWGLVQSLKIRLLAMLHGGFVWLGIALALQAVSHALMAMTQHQFSLGLAPLHALTMGYLGATLFAMATRVASGHSGRPLAADNIAWVLYWVVQLAVLLRVVSALWPAAGQGPLLLSISAWSLAACGWSLRYGSWVGRPRVDGRPG